MARLARENIPGALTHIVSKFAGTSTGFRADRDRRAYLARVDSARCDSDWELLAYALLPDRIHWLAIAGETALSRLIKPLHVGFALWLNRSQRHDGPVFSDRPRTLESDPRDAARLIAWLHNSPVRQGMVAEAAASTWTSHQAYLGAVPRPAWLNVGRALDLCGLKDDETGRQVVAGWGVTPGDTEDLLVRPSGATRSASIGKAILAPRRWDGALGQIVSEVALATSIAHDRIRSTDRSRVVVAARRATILAGTRYLGRSLGEMAALVGISTSSASRLVRADPTTLHRAAMIAEEVAGRLLGAHPEDVSVLEHHAP